ncbi:MAG: hypothetical protein WC824_08310, partial [Bacteroidota bacterium]
MRTRKLIIILVSIAALFVAGSVHLIYTPRMHETASPVEIRRGTSLRGIASVLAEHDIISNRYLFMLAAKLSDRGRHLQSGL